MDDDEDDEEPKGPTKYEFSVESKLDEDHLFYLQFTNNFISNVSRPRDFDHCTRWLERLAGEPMYGVEAKRNRNMFLAMLLCAMQDNKVKGPFSTFPPSGPLPNAAIAFGLTNPEDEGQGDMMFDEIDRELNMSDYSHTSEDGRTYIATCALPNSSGVMAYVGLTFGGGEGLWLNKEGYQVPLATGDRIPAVTPVTPVRKYMDMIAEHRQKVRDGLDQEPEEPSEDAFKFLIDMPMSSSDADLLELGSYKLAPKNAEFLLDLYPQELVDALQDFLVASKKDIEKRLQARHEKLVKDMYREYSQEIERGLREYKEARQEWALVYQVVAELKEVVKEREAKDNEAASQGKSETASGRPTGLLIQSLNDSKSRQKAQYKIGQELDSKKTEIHKEIHERAMFHVHEIERFEAHVARLTADICKLRQDNKKKQQVIQTLNLQLENMKSDM